MEGFFLRKNWIIRTLVMKIITYFFCYLHLLTFQMDLKKKIESETIFSRTQVQKILWNQQTKLM